MTGGLLFLIHFNILKWNAFLLFFLSMLECTEHFIVSPFLSLLGYLLLFLFILIMQYLSSIY